jgi:hypothetical protein
MTRNSYSIEFKIKVAKILQRRKALRTDSENSLLDSISDSSKSEWKRKYTQHQDARFKRAKRTMHKGGKTKFSSREEQEICEFLDELRSSLIPIPVHIAIRYMTIRFPNLRTMKSSAQTSWFTRFRKRHGYSNRRVTTRSNPLLVAEREEIRSEFLVYVKQRVEDAKLMLGIDDSDIILVNADQTAIYFDNAPLSNVTHTGVKHVPAITTTSARNRMTAMLAGTNSGQRLDPYFVLQATPPSETSSQAPRKGTVAYEIDGDRALENGYPVDAIMDIQLEGYFDTRVLQNWLDKVHWNE